jgi:hypothetical protein
LAAIADRAGHSCVQSLQPPRFVLGDGHIADLI